MEQVFPCPRTALAIFVQRIFEQRVQVWPALTTTPPELKQVHAPLPTLLRHAGVRCQDP